MSEWRKNGSLGFLVYKGHVYWVETYSSLLRMCGERVSQQVYLLHQYWVTCEKQKPTIPHHCRSLPGILCQGHIPRLYNISFLNYWQTNKTCRCLCHYPRPCLSFFNIPSARNGGKASKWFSLLTAKIAYQFEPQNIIYTSTSSTCFNFHHHFYL